MYSGDGLHCSASYPRVPFIATIVPKAAAATADVRKAFEEFDPHYIFGHLIAERALDSEAQRRAMGHRQRCAVHIVGKDRLGVKGIVETNALVIPVYATFHMSAQWKTTKR